MKRLTTIVGLFSTTALLSVGVAAAASLGLGTGQLSAGRVAVVGCASSPLTATRNVDNQGLITQVNVLNVPQACAGETLAVTLEDAGGAALGGASALVGSCSGGCTVSVAGFGPVPGAGVSAYALSLTE